MKNKKKQVLLMMLGIIGLIAITVGVTYAFFSYTKEGTTDNSVTTGTITFLYTEIDQVGAGISLTNAFPISDSQGKALTGDNEVFDFKITSNTPSNSSIPYEITARKKIVENMLDEEAVRIYLTKNNGTEEEVLLDNYSNLDQTTKVDSSKYIEKTLHTDKVPANSTNYEQAYRLRMWVSDDVDFSPVKDEEGNDTYPYNNKEFTVTVNVYANAKVVTEEDIANESKAEINILSIDGTELTAVEGQDYDYEMTLPEGTISTTIDVETISEYATVTIEKLDGLAYSSNVKRLSSKKTLDLANGDNYFKITVTSENGEVENEYTLKVFVGTLSGAIFSRYTTIYENPTLTTSSNNTTDASGLYKSTATNFNGIEGTPTYYFRGNVENNYVDFAGFTWRIVRINEDGTIRIVMQDGINSDNFNSIRTSKDKMYYSNSNAKTQLETWYSSKIASNQNYSSKVASGNYYCEQAKVALSSTHATKSGTGMTVYSSYAPNFKCSTDANGYGIVNSNVGLLTYDEVVHAGGYCDKSNSSYYLYSGTNYWTMSTAGFSKDSYADVWFVNSAGFYAYSVTNPYSLRAVLNLKADTTVIGNGTSDSPWKVQ